jgi:cysteinyl-tRNA synthetase
VNINHEKMSKSLNNFLTIRDVLRHHHPEAVRMFLLSSHYRSPIDFTPEAMAEASAKLTRVYTLLRRLAGRSPAAADEIDRNPFWRRFTEEMDDDFNTAAGIGTLFEAVRATNQLLDDPDAANGEIAANHRAILRMATVLGIATLDAEAYFKSQAKDVDPARVEELIARRAAARQTRDWAEADRLRDLLSAMGVAIEDRPEGTVWRVAD